MEYGCIGEKLGHSFSKEIHTKIGEYQYELKEVAKEELDSFMKASDFKGVNVTIPYKERVIPYLDFVDEKARKIGAVNTIINQDGCLKGYNTDFDGMTALIKKMGLDFLGKEIFILGTGGTSKTAAAVAESHGAKKITKVGRVKREGNISYEELYEKKEEVQILVNTTPCGMFPNVQESPVDVEQFPNLEGVVDAVYNPMKSKLILEAQERGVKAEGGLYMLVSQAVAAAEHFTGHVYGEKLTDGIYRDVFRKKENLVLIGMPGCGKTTLAKLLSKKLKMNWKDTDKELERQHGKSCKEIIKEEGVMEFRRLESEIVKDLAKETHLILATGGGAVLNPENVKALRMNGRLCFVDRPIEKIVPTRERPLSSDRESLFALYEERLPIYQRSCDFRIENGGDEEAFIEKFLGQLEGDLE